MKMKTKIKQIRMIMGKRQSNAWSRDTEERKKCVDYKKFDKRWKK